MPQETMSSRERILAVMEGLEVDRFPVWLKMANSTWKASQPEPYRSMDEITLLREAGCDLFLNNWTRVERSTPYVKQTVQNGENLKTTVYETPDGPLVASEHYDVYTSSWHPAKYPVETASELRMLRWLFTDTTYRVESGRAEAAQAKQREFVANDAVTSAGIGPGPLMSLVEHLCGPENTTFLMYDERELFEETLQIMHEDRMRHLKALLPVTHADAFWLIENTSTSLISPQMFRDYCMPHLRDYGNLIREHEIIAVHHMCGLLNPILEMIDELPAQVNEAYTTRPLGNVSLAEGRRRMPSKALIGGTNAVLWMNPVEEIVQTVADDLAQCPDRRRIFLSSAGILPPGVDMAKARQVVEGLKKL